MSLALLRDYPGYRRLWASDTISQLGDWCSVVAVSVLSTRGGAGPLPLAVAFVAHLLPGALAAPFAGSIADRYDRRRVLLVAAALEGLATVAMFVAASRALGYAIPALVVLRSFVASLREPALGAALPRVVPEAALGRANALGAMSWSVTFALGMALGGLLSGVSPRLALGVDALSFSAAGLVLRGLPALPPTEPGADQPRLGALIARLWSAFGVSARGALRGSLRPLVLAKGPVAVVSGAAWMALNLVSYGRPLAVGAATTIGILHAVRGLGTGLGPAPINRLSARIGLPRAFAVSLGVTVFGALLFLSSARPAALVLGALFWGIGTGSNWVLSTTALQRQTPEASLGRVLALDGLVAAASMALSALATGALVDRGVPVGYCVLGAAVLAPGFAWAIRAQSARTPVAGSSIAPLAL